MQVAFNIRLYEYGHEQVKLRKKRWNKFFLLILLLPLRVDTCKFPLTCDLNGHEQVELREKRWNNKESCF
jgi:hypothetical protein